MLVCIKPVDVNGVETTLGTGPAGEEEGIDISHIPSRVEHDRAGDG